MKRLFINIAILGLLIMMLTSCGKPSEDNNTQIEDEQNEFMQDSSATINTNNDKLDNNKTEDKINSKPTSNTTETKPGTDEGKNNILENKPNSTPDKPSTTPNKPNIKPSKPDLKPEKPVTPTKPEKTYSISEVHKLIKDAYGSDYIANSALSKDMLGSLMGVNTVEVAQFIAEQPMISANIDTFVAIKAVGGKGASVAAALSSYKTYLTSPDAMMYPSNIPKAQAAQVVRHGDYVFFVMIGARNDNEDADDAAQLKFAQEQVQKGVNVIDNYFAK